MGGMYEDMDKNITLCLKSDMHDFFPEDLARTQLRHPLVVTNVARKVFSLGQGTQDEIVTTNRLILILRGKLDYTVEGRTRRMGAGAQIFVPAWVRRVWTVPRSGPCEILWCEFDEEGAGTQQAGCHLRKTDAGSLREEKQAHQNLWRLWKNAGDSWRALQLEGELKVMLIRFWRMAEPAFSDQGNRPRAALHPRIKEALRLAESHYREADALETLYREAGMSRNYFRILFTTAMQCSPHVYIERLRMRQARYLLHSTDWQLKRISAEVGYDDPLYFSRLYRRFWKRAPSAERKSSGPRAEI